MTVIEGLRSFLLGNTQIATMVETRIFPLRLPEKLTIAAGKGAIVLTRIDDIGSAHLRGVSGLSRARIQIDAWALNHDDATALGSLCRQRIDGFKGTWTDSGSPESQLQVQAILQADERDYFDEDILGGFCRHSADYFVSYVAVGESMLI